MGSMTRLRLSYFGPGPILVAALLAAAVVTYAWPKLRAPSAYPDPVVGALAYADDGKAQDFRAAGLFLAVAVVGAAAIGGVCHRAAPDGPASDAGVAVNQLLLLALAPAAWRLMASAVNPLPVPPPPVRTVAAIAGLAVAAVVMMARCRGTVRAADVLSLGGGVVLAPLFAAFAGVGMVVAVGRTVPTAAAHLDGKASAVGIAALVAAVAALAAVAIVTSDGERLHRRVMRCLVAVQVPLPLLLFVVVPAPLVDPRHLLPTPYPWGLVATVAVLCGLGVWRVVRRWGDPTPSIRRAIAPAAVIALAVFVQCDNLPLPTVNPDLFHWGEQALPWQQLRDFGSRPYVDFVPIHGLMAYLTGAFNQAFFDGTAAHAAGADVLLQATAAAAAAAAVAWLVSPVAALFVLPVLLPYLDRLCFLAPAICVVAAPGLLRRPGRWLAVWPGLCLFMVAYNPALGPAFVVGSLPVAGWMAWRLWRDDRRALLIGILATVVTLGGAAAVPVVRLVAAGFARFVVDNAWTNDVGNGIAWSAGWGMRPLTTGYGSSQLSWELYRFGWVGVAVTMAAVAWRELTRPARRPAVVALGSVTAIVLVVGSPWVMGRIDPGSLSRSGATSQTALAFLVPPLVWLAGSRATVGRNALVLAALTGLVQPVIPTRLDPAELAAKAEAVRVVPPGVTIEDGAALGLPGLGRVVAAEPDIVPSAARLSRGLAGLLRPGETYLDLGNGSGRYFFLGLRNPVLYAPYVACNGRLQAAMRRQLRDRPVPVVLAAPAELFDGTPTSLRCYALYRQYAMTFAAVHRDEFVLLVDPTRVPEAGPIGGELQLQLLDSAFVRPDLARLPTAWGRSWPTLRERFESVATAAPAADGSFNIPPAVTDGAAADFLRLTLDAGPAEVPVELRWVAADGGESAPVRFVARSGDLVVPLGAYPRWLLGKHPTAIRLTVPDPRHARFTVAEFLRLKPL